MSGRQDDGMDIFRGILWAAVVVCLAGCSTSKTVIKIPPGYAGGPIEISVSTTQSRGDVGVDTSLEDVVDYDKDASQQDSGNTSTATSGDTTVEAPAVVPVDPEEDPQPVGEWRGDLAEIEAVNGLVRFQTKDVQAPTTTKPDGSSEYIIGRASGSGFERLLVMTMDRDGDRRAPSRIFFDGEMVDDLYPVPLPGVHSWEIEANGGPIVVRLDGDEVWSREGSYTVSGVTMNGYDGRGFLGQWRTVE